MIRHSSLTVGSGLCIAVPTPHEVINVWEHFSQGQRPHRDSGAATRDQAGCGRRGSSRPHLHAQFVVVLSDRQVVAELLAQVADNRNVLAAEAVAKRSRNPRVSSRLVELCEPLEVRDVSRVAVLREIRLAPIGKLLQVVGPKPRFRQWRFLGAIRINA